MKSDTLSEAVPRDTFTGGLHPVSLKREMKRDIRENEASQHVYADVKKEALRWMKEDNCPDTTTQQL